MNKAKSTRRVMLLARTESPTWRLPHRQALALAFLEVAATHDGPATTALEDAPAREDLVVDVAVANEPGNPPGDLHRREEQPRVGVLALKFIEHRVADRRILRLMRKWLKAGVSEDGQWSETDKGTPQGAVASPLIANVYMHYLFDLWADVWRRKAAKGD